jgi:hypothetical protein
MSTESVLRGLPARARRRLVTTATVSRGAVGRRDAQAVLVGSALLYLVAFLYALRDLVVRRSAGLSVTVADAPVETALQQGTGPFTYRPAALLELGVVVWEFSPLNTLLGVCIAGLVGLNFALSYLAVTQPRSCGVGAGAGVVASVPALLAGSTCCAPVVVLVLGIQASSALLTAFVWLLPVSVLLLVSTLVYVAGKIDPAVMTGQNPVEQ